MDVNALLSSGATEVVRDASLVRGQQNPMFWQQYMSGHTPPTPDVPDVYKKFVDQFRAAGINVVRDNNKINIMAMTNKDVDAMAEDRDLQAADTVHWRDGLKPVTGGLFDPTLTGGHGGNRWSAIRLHEPMLNPVMEEPARRLLGMTEAKFRDVLSGRESLNGFHGPKAIFQALSAIDLDREIAATQRVLANGKRTARDQASRKLGYLKAAKRLNIHPRDWMLERVPVLPPKFRPVSVMQSSKRPMVADPNYLYKDLFDANANLKNLADDVDDLSDERLAVYDAMKAVTGLGEPVQQKTRDRQVKGLLSQIFGSSPKYGVVQQKLIGSAVDIVGRAVITPNPDLDMDQVGLPENAAWNVYRPFVIRRLVRDGVPKMEAVRQYMERKPIAREAMLKELAARPVLIDRAPVLHRYGVMAFWPRLTKGDTLQVPPLIVKGFGADFDGDQMNYHVPVTDEAVEDAVQKLLPSRNLLSTQTFKVHQLPANEYVGGLYTASSKRDNKRRARVFASAADALAAYRRGEIDADHPVEIAR